MKSIYDIKTGHSDTGAHEEHRLQSVICLIQYCSDYNIEKLRKGLKSDLRDKNVPQSWQKFPFKDWLLTQVDGGINKYTCRIFH